MDVDGAGVTVEQEDIPTCTLSPFALFDVLIPPPQIPRSKHPPPYCLPATTATSQVSKCASLISSSPRVGHADAAITGTVHRSTHGAQVPRQERLRSHQEPGALTPPSPLLAHPTPDGPLFLFRRVPAPQRTTSPPEGSTPSSNSDERQCDACLVICMLLPSCMKQ